MSIGYLPYIRMHILHKFLFNSLFILIYCINSYLFINGVRLENRWADEGRLAK